MSLHVPAAVERRVKTITNDHLRRTRRYPPTHLHAGSNPERQSVGDPGHCEPCAVVGHVEAHPDYGCGDVGCTINH